MKHNFISKKYWNSISTPMGESFNLVDLLTLVLEIQILQLMKESSKLLLKMPKMGIPIIRILMEI